MQRAQRVRGEAQRLAAPAYHPRHVPCHLRKAAQFQNLATTSPEALIIDCSDRSVTPCSSFYLCCLGGGRNASDGPNHTVLSNNLRGPESGRPIPLAVVWGPGFLSQSSSYYRLHALQRSPSGKPGKLLVWGFPGSINPLAPHSRGAHQGH